MHLQGTKPWTPAATAYSAVRATLLAAATLFVTTSGYVITSDLPTIHELGYQFSTNFSTIHPIREDQEEKRAQL